MLIWTTEYETGIRQIDQQHQELLTLINETTLAYDQNSNNEKAILEQALRRLQTYALFHFGTEESLLNEAGIPHDHSVAHRASHKAFTDRIARLKKTADEGSSSALPDLLDYLQSWLPGHILKSDKALGKLLSNRNRIPC